MEPQYPTGAEGDYTPGGDPHSTSTVWTCANGNYIQYEERVAVEPYYRWWVYYFNLERQEYVSTEISRGADEDLTTWTQAAPGWGDLVSFIGWYIP